MQDLVASLLLLPIFIFRLFKSGREEFEKGDMRVPDLTAFIAIVIAVDYHYGVYLNTIFWAISLGVWALTLKYNDPTFDGGKLKTLDLFLTYTSYIMALLFAYHIQPYQTAWMSGFAVVKSVQQFSAQFHVVFQWIAFLFFSDFMAYFVHRASHSKYLWRFHASHHSPSEVNILSGQRATFVHIVSLYLPATLAANLFIVEDSQLAVMLRFCFDQLNQGYIHSNIRLPYAHLIEKLMITPRVHLIHHNRSPEVGNSNYAFYFTIYDRMFGTYIDPDSITDRRMGLDEVWQIDLDPISINFGWDIFRPFRKKTVNAEKRHSGSPPKKDQDKAA